MFNISMTICVAFLFFILTPGVLLRIPRRGSLIYAAIVHSIVFALLYYLIHKIVSNTVGGQQVFDASKSHPAYLNLDKKSTVKKFTVKNSTIHGVGVFANKNIERNEIIDCAIKLVNKPDKKGKTYEVTHDFGGLINHSSLKDNTDLIKLKDGYYLTATKYIPKNTEMLINYDGKTIPDFIKGSKPHYKQ
jgi:hypothetical protein